MMDDHPWTVHDGTAEQIDMPPPSEEYQRAHGWQDGKPPPGNGKSRLGDAAPDLKDCLPFR